MGLWVVVPQKSSQASNILAVGVFRGLDVFSDVPIFPIVWYFS
jgi:hypothetical protein